MIGILVIDKPGGMTSHDVVARIRKRFGTRKVGHLGTLDPMATGVLPLTIGKATRLARYVSNSPKEYSGRIRLGWATTTCDIEGERVGDPVEVDIAPARLAEALTGFLGPIQQVPPAYSAKKVSGTPAHRLARKGVEVRLEPVRVVVDRFDLAGFTPPEFDFRVVCSGGTYIRSLARDLGERLGTGGHLVALRRTRSGPFALDQAVDLDRASGIHLIGPTEFLGDLPQIQVDEAGEQAVVNGRPVPCPAPLPGAGADLCIFNKKGELIAMASANGVWANPRVVLL